MAVCRFRLAVNRKYKREGENSADFLNVVAFGKTAETIQKYFRKGDLILVSSHVQTGTYKNKDGINVNTVDYIVDSFEFVASGKSREGKTEPKADEPVFVPPSDGEGLPWD